MHHEQEKERKIAEVKAELARHSKNTRMTFTIVVALAAAVLVVLLAHLSGPVELLN
ncbi:hypothetical protein HPT29_018700 [Microvirga terrae]|uniref:Uncharacterized protein n=1 Tax=Microvirga terrae TaxID=2740529 RepID=A0ABY5RQ93_9HYPH|nr:hypothetical protein [Microvirga terrae]UVF18501.1 hypothetical protein HPT29_018700 [Microvirga terrae]